MMIIQVQELNMHGHISGTTIHGQKAKLILLAYGIKYINSHIQILNLTSTNYHHKGGEIVES